MRVFVTGASGWIGRAVVPELIAAGHEVVGLARSADSAAALAKAGAEVRHGTIDDLDVLRAAASDADGVIHLAFKHDIAFSGDFQGATDADRLAVEAFGAALAGADRPFVIASGVPRIPGAVGTERDGVDTDPAEPSRMGTARITLDLAERGVRSSVLRLPPTVHGEGDNGFVAALVGVAKDKGVSGYPGDGTTRWSAVHRCDAARLFRLALEKAPAGSTLHAVAEEGVETRAIAEAIGRRLDVPVASVEPDELGWVGAFFAANAAASSTLTRELLGWQPEGPGLIEDIAKY